MVDDQNRRAGCFADFSFAAANVAHHIVLFIDVAVEGPHQGIDHDKDARTFGLIRQEKVPNLLRHADHDRARHKLPIFVDTRPKLFLRDAVQSVTCLSPTP